MPVYPGALTRRFGNEFRKKCGNFRPADQILGTLKMSVGFVKFYEPSGGWLLKPLRAEQKERGRRGMIASLEFCGSVDSLEWPAVTEQQTQAVAGLPGGVRLVLDEIAECDVCDLRLDLLKA
jgi:hypothetical protein